MVLPLCRVPWANVIYARQGEFVPLGVCQSLGTRVDAMFCTLRATTVVAWVSSHASRGRAYQGVG